MTFRTRTAVRLAPAAFAAGVALAAGFALAAQPAAAHAVLTGSTPEDGATLTEAPSEVVLEFNEPIRVEFTQVAVLDANDNHHEVGDPEIAGSTVTQEVGPLEPGDYRISYRVGSDDGHPVSGILTFAVAGATGELGDAAGPDDDAADDELFGGAGVWLGLAAVAAVATMLILLIVRRPGDRGRQGGSDTEN